MLIHRYILLPPPPQVCLHITTHDCYRILTGSNNDKRSLDVLLSSLACRQKLNHLNQFRKKFLGNLPGVTKLDVVLF